MTSWRLLLSGSWVGWLGDMHICSLTTLGKFQFQLTLYPCSFLRRVENALRRWHGWQPTGTCTVMHDYIFKSVGAVQSHQCDSFSLFFGLILPQTFTSELALFLETEQQEELHGCHSPDIFQSSTLWWDELCLWRTYFSLYRRKETWMTS